MNFKKILEEVWVKFEEQAGDPWFLEQESGFQSPSFACIKNKQKETKWNPLKNPFILFTEDQVPQAQGERAPCWAKWGLWKVNHWVSDLSEVFPSAITAASPLLRTTANLLQETNKIQVKSELTAMASTLLGFAAPSTLAAHNRTALLSGGSRISSPFHWSHKQRDLCGSLSVYSGHSPLCQFMTY